MQLASTLAFASLAFAATIDINVGQGGLVFNPNSVTANVGDELVFHYFPKAHDVTQSSFAAPCRPLAGGINSGFNPVTSGESATTFTANVTSTAKPLWFYCGQKNHCQGGMAMVVNVQPGPNSLAAYIAAAAKVQGSEIGPSVEGGIFSNETSSTAAILSTSTSSTSSSSTGVWSTGVSSTPTSSAGLSATTSLTPGSSSNASTTGSSSTTSSGAVATQTTANGAGAVLKAGNLVGLSGAVALLYALA